MTAAIAVTGHLLAVPFTSAQASESGVRAPALRARRFRRLFQGVYVCRDVPMSLERWIAAARLVAPPDAVVSHLTALRCLGVEVGPRWPLRLETAGACHLRRDRLHIARVVRLPPRRAGIASPEHCFAVACADLDLLDAVIVGDALVQLQHATPASLAAVVGNRSGRGVRTARRAVTLVRVGAESPRETYVRLMLVLAGLPEPECNLNVGTCTAFIGRGDLVFAAYRLVVEYDGRQHADVRQQWEHDLDRHDAFDLSAWRVVRVSRHRLRAPRAVVRVVHAKLVAQGYSGPAPTFGPEWVALFETTTAAARARIALADSWD